MRSPSLSLALGALALVAACTPPALPPAPPPPPRPAPAPTVTPDAPFRGQAPAPAPEPTFVPPVIAQAALSNGVPVLLVERHDMPVVEVRIVVRRGGEVGAPGVGAFVGAMLSQGTKHRSALAISDAFETIGADWGTGASYDATLAHAQVVSSQLDPALDLLADCVRNSSFPRAEVERERAKRLSTLAQDRDRPATLLANMVGFTLYPDGHAYKLPLMGTDASLRAVKPDTLSQFFHDHFTPDRATIVVAGDVTKDVLVAKLERAFGSWRGRAAKVDPPAAPPPPAAGEPRVVLVDRPGATQTGVAVAQVGVARTTEDFYPLLVASTILGGQFTSRLNLNLREKHAFTYGASASFEMRHGPGPFRAGGAIVREHTAEAVQEIFAEIERIAKEPVADDELADAKSYLVRKLPAQFETVQETASSVAQLAVYGLPLDDYATRAAKIAAVTAAEVQKAVAAHLSAEALRVVLVGDAAAIRGPLEALGLGAPLEYPASK